MAENIFFAINVDTGKAVPGLASLKQGIQDVQRNQRELNKRFKEGQISQSAFARSSAKNDLALKSLRTEYTKAQRAALGFNNSQQSFSRRIAGRVTRNIGKLALGITAAVAAFRAISNAVSNSIQKFDEQAKAEAALEVGLGRTSSKLLEQASALQSVTRFGDEAIIAGQALLAQFGATEEQIEKLTPALLDFAQAQGISVRDAANLLGKSIGSSTNALSRYGIQIEGAVGSNERLENAIENINEKFGGQAEAATTGAGALVQFQNNVGDLMESLGGFLAGVLNPVVQGMNRFIEVFKTAREDVSFFEKAIVGIGSALGLTTGMFAGLEKSIQKTNEEQEGFLDNVHAWADMGKTMTNVGRTISIINSELKILRDDLKDATIGSEEFATIQEEIKVLEEELAIAMGKQTQAQKDAEKAAKKRADEDKKRMEERLALLEEGAQLELELRQSAEDARINAIEDEQQNRLAQLEVGFERELELLDQQQQRLMEIQLETGMNTTEAQALINQQRLDLEKKFRQDVAEVEEDALKESEKDRQKTLDGEQKLQDERLSVARSTLGVLGNIAKEGTAAQKVALSAQKALAIAEVGINLQRELSTISASTAADVTGITRTIKIIAAAARAAGILASLRGITFQDGGILEGPSHAAGGVPVRLASGGMVEAEGGEAIINKRSTEMFRPQLSAINAAGGGKKFQDGGQLPNVGLQSTQTFATNELNNAISGINLRPVVSVEEIKEVQNRVEVIEQTATL